MLREISQTSLLRARVTKVAFMRSPGGLDTSLGEEEVNGLGDVPVSDVAWALSPTGEGCAATGAAGATGAACSFSAAGVSGEVWDQPWPLNMPFAVS